MYLVFHCQNDLKTQKKTCRNKLGLSSGTLMFRLKEKFSVFLGLDITLHAIECGGTTCPDYRESCHRWPSLIKGSLTTTVLRSKGIRYCSIVAKGSFKTLAYHSLPKSWIQKTQESWNKMCDN